MIEHDRRQGIGASEAAAILGWSKFQTSLEVYQHKTAEEPQGFHDALDNSPMYWGHRLERIILEEYAKREGAATMDHQKRFEAGLFWATVDAIAVPVGGEEFAAVVNAKTSRSDAGWGDVESGEVPLYYLAQAVIEMYCTKMQEWHCPVLFAGSRLEIYKVKRDQNLEQTMLKELEAWWQRHVVARVPPDPITAKDLTIAYPQNMGTIVKATIDEIEQINKLKALRAEIAVLEAQEEAFQIALKKKIGEADGLIYEGNVLATWKMQTRKAYTVPDKSYRVFRLK